MSEQADTFKEERASTYVMDAGNFSEVARLCKQHRLLASGMKRPVPELESLAGIHDVLDVACGAGGWMIDLALENPGLQITGLDNSATMLEYARSSVLEEQVRNIHLRQMDATKPLEFLDNVFDFVNARLLTSFMPRTIWPRFLRECARVTRKGGFIRLTEAESALTNSRACEEIHALLNQSFFRAGMGFSPDGRHGGVTPMLRRLLTDAGCRDVNIYAYVVDCSAGTPEHRRVYQDGATGYKLVQPYLLKHEVATQPELDRLYHLALEDMKSPDFCGLWTFITVVGEVKK
ncbi:class I SAM-dependent methyltransferase [Ktedonospora formicarum]|uniref:Methyltransferase domain-containing protein n=1 Tax=Ktedonospora formicarum TaxID=2778364 RepID=A0A8J3MVP3_9CHLR|nr:class I SAM-dependent methyltransferase [Ktedonospora formicarum]GHO46715.1 hypothetical protein KSX_48780 [Ktedonospora formicarum]